MSTWRPKLGQALTPDEGYILSRLIAGESLMRISKDMEVTYGTVGNAAYRLRMKLGARNMYEACVLYDRQLRTSRDPSPASASESVTH